MLCWIFPRCRKARAWRRHSGLVMASHCTGFRSAARTSVPTQPGGARSSMRIFRPAAPGSTSQTQQARNPCWAHNDCIRPLRRRRGRPDRWRRIAACPAGRGCRYLCQLRRRARRRSGRGMAAVALCRCVEGALPLDRRRLAGRVGWPQAAQPAGIDGTRRHRDKPAPPGRPGAAVGQQASPPLPGPWRGSRGSPAGYHLAAGPRPPRRSHRRSGTRHPDRRCQY